MIMLGYVRDGIVYLATDTTIVEKDVKANRLASGNYKIKKMENGLIVGITGVPNVRQRLLVRDNLFTLDKNGKLTKNHIVDKIIPALHRFLKDNDLYEIDEDGMHDPGVNIFLAYGDKLYDISERLWVYRVTRKTANGALSDLCESALNRIDPERDIEKQLVEVMQRATTYTNYIGGPYVTINTKDNEIHVTEAK